PISYHRVPTHTVGRNQGTRGCCDSRAKTTVGADLWQRRRNRSAARSNMRSRVSIISSALLPSTVAVQAEFVDLRPGSDLFVRHGNLILITAANVLAAVNAPQDVGLLLVPTARLRPEILQWTAESVPLPVPSSFGVEPFRDGVPNFALRIEHD